MPYLCASTIIGPSCDKHGSYYSVALASLSFHIVATCQKASKSQLANCGDAVCQKLLFLSWQRSPTRLRKAPRRQHTASTPDIIHSYLFYWAYHEIFGATPALAFWGPNTWTSLGSRTAGMLGIEYWVLGSQPPSSARLMHRQDGVYTCLCDCPASRRSLSLFPPVTRPFQPHHHLDPNTMFLKEPCCIFLPSAVHLSCFSSTQVARCFPRDAWTTAKLNGSPPPRKTIVNPLFLTSPSFICPPCSLVSRPLLHSRFATTRRRQPSPLLWPGKTGLQMLPIICTSHTTSPTILPFH